jgi:thiol:disulfide interchange protein
MRQTSIAILVLCSLGIVGCGDTPTSLPKEAAKATESPKPAASGTTTGQERMPPPEQPESSQAPTEWGQALARAKAENKLVFVEFSATWCPPCQQMKHDTFANAQVRTKLADYVPLFVDTDRDPDLSQRFGVRGIPAYFVVRADRAIVNSGSGYKGPSDFLRWLQGNR